MSFRRDDKVRKDRETSAPALDEDGARPSEIIADQTSVLKIKIIVQMMILKRD